MPIQNVENFKHLIFYKICWKKIQIVLLKEQNNWILTNDKN